MNELALFAGAGGGILGGKLLGWTTICAVEWEPYPASVLCARQNDKILPPFPIWDDVQTFDGKPWRGIVDVVSGGFPCQDISSAGRGAGIDGERSSMWKHMARIICEVQPRYAFVENSPLLTKRGLSRVLWDLASMGYDAKWGVLGAAEVGANHKRDRIWIVGKMAGSRCKLRTKRNTTELDSQTQIGTFSSIYDQSSCSRQMANPKELLCNGSNNNSRISMEGESESKFRNDCRKSPIPNSNLSQQQGNCLPIGIQSSNALACNSCWWEVEPSVGRVANGVAAGVDRLKAIGNGQVPLCAATAWRMLTK